MAYIFKSDSVTEQNVSFFAFVVRVHKLIILNFFKTLYFWFDDGIGGIRIDWFGIMRTFDFRFSFLIDFDFRTQASFGSIYFTG